MHFLGYPFGIKGHKLYDFHTNTVLISGNVIFHEQVFPYHSTQTTSLNPSYLSPTQSLILLLTIPYLFFISHTQLFFFYFPYLLSQLPLQNPHNPHFKKFLYFLGNRQKSRSAPVIFQNTTANKLIYLPSPPVVPYPVIPIILMIFVIFSLILNCFTNIRLSQ